MARFHHFLHTNYHTLGASALPLLILGPCFTTSDTHTHTTTTQWGAVEKWLTLQPSPAASESLENNGDIVRPGLGSRLWGSVCVNDRKVICACWLCFCPSSCEKKQTKKIWIQKNINNQNRICIPRSNSLLILLILSNYKCSMVAWLLLSILLDNCWCYHLSFVFNKQY